MFQPSAEVAAERYCFCVEMVKYKTRSARFLVFWVVNLAGQVVPDVLEDRVAFV
jgi:hypothetical protein